ncbi:beta-1,4-galactosyltransferase galt-1-like [Limulus polyphemus]|uniref:Glycosyltransferase family 92 protein n=1 Tax=Limulus polyphemus TaxID=6850 RepID=A0ABM1BUD5_LIMPO|nr:beta-1,4-galactosyltransferase galt-1-like [Limulus polyphemus]
MTLRRRFRLAKMVGTRRISKRQHTSFYFVLTFLLLFICILFIEVFFVEENNPMEFSIFERLGWKKDTNKEIVLPPHVARELARVITDAVQEDLDVIVNLYYDAVVDETGALGNKNVDHWQPVRGTKDKFLVFSAYYDDRRVQLIRVIAAARTRNADKVMCKFWFADGYSSTTVPAFNKLIQENWNLKYSAYFVLCPLSKALPSVPERVSIITSENAEITNWLVVHNNKQNVTSPHGIAVCVKPVHYDYNKLLSFIEFIELNKIFGVEHFILYNDTIGRDVACVMRQYMANGIMSVLPWKLDMVSQKEIRTEGLFAALNDCLYRTMYRFRFVLMIDFDEFIVPHKSDSLTEMLEVVAKNKPLKTGAYSFQNSFFYLQWPSDAKSRSLPLRLITLEKTVRKLKFHPHKQRSKCIVLPERVVEMGNHFVWEFLPGRAMANVHSDIGFLHHYRICEFGGNDCINTTSRVDRRIYRWKDQLVQAVQTRLKDWEFICNFFAVSADKKTSLLL